MSWNLFAPRAFRFLMMTTLKHSGDLEISQRVQGVTDLATLILPRGSLCVVWNSFFFGKDVKASMVSEIRAIEKVGFYAN